METEIWPNLMRACQQAGVKTVLINGRISSRSYPRYRMARWFFRRVLANVDRFCMQSEESARRIVDMGADPARVTVTGSLKFDSLDIPGVPGSPSADRGRNRVLRYFRITPDRPVLIAASTLKGEEEPVLEAFQRIRATRGNALLIVAPRKPERFDDVERLARRGGWNVARRTELRVDAEPRHDVVILDTIGELAQLFQVGTLVFVGGSLVDAGGHNILEPAVFGKPIVFGPHMQNFTEIARTFLDNGAALQVRDGRELERVLLELLGDPVRRASLGAAARALVEANRGARSKSLTAIAQVLPPDYAGNVRPFRLVQ
jgi:3-deoxy-D-manno-octulosonic-acid transferase